METPQNKFVDNVYEKANEIGKFFLSLLVHFLHIMDNLFSSICFVIISIILLLLFFFFN